MNNISLGNFHMKSNQPNLSMNGHFRAEGIAWSTAFIVTFVLVVSGNILTIVLFVMNKNIRKKSLFLVINMAYADLLVGAVSLPIFIYDVGIYFRLWTDGTWGLWSNRPLTVSFMIVDTVFSQASLISAAFISCERFYAIYWPFKYRTLSARVYHIVIFTAWMLALLISAVWTASNILFSSKHTMLIWGPYTLVLTLTTCGCNICIWKKFQRGCVAVSHRQNRDLQNKRLTKTLLFVSGLTLLAWLPLVILNFLRYVWLFPVQQKFYLVVNLFNYFNSFVNPVVYVLRIAEFRHAMARFCICRERNYRQHANDLIRSADLHSAATFIHELAFEQEVIDTQL